MDPMVCCELSMFSLSKSRHKRVNPSDADATNFFQGTKNAKNCEKPSQPCHVGIHGKALIEY